MPPCATATTETGTISALTYNPMRTSIPQHLHPPSPGMHLERKNTQLPVSAPSRLLSLLPRDMYSHPSSLFLFLSPPAPYPPTAVWPYTGPTLTHAVPTRTFPCTPSLRTRPYHPFEDHVDSVAPGGFIEHDGAARWCPALLKTTCSVSFILAGCDAHWAQTTCWPASKMPRV